MGFLGSVIADARSSATVSAVACSPPPVAESGHGGLHTAFAIGVGNGDAAPDVSRMHRSQPSVITAPVSGLEKVSRESGQLPDAVFPAAPTALMASEHRPDIDLPGKTEVETVWHESGINPLEGVDITSRISAETFVDELMPMQPQPGRAIVAPFPTGPTNEPATDVYSPLPIGGWASEQTLHESDEVFVMTDSPMPTSLPPDLGILLTSKAPEVSPLSIRLPEQNTPYASVSAANPDPEHVVRPEKRLSASAKDDAEVKPQSLPVANSLFPQVEKRPIAAPVIAELAVREPPVVRRQEGAGHYDAGSTQIVRTEAIKAVIHSPRIDALAREKAGFADYAVPESRVKQSQGSARSTIMQTMSQPSTRAPEVKIGQVDVFIEAPKRSGNAPQPSFRPTHSLASRHYLRRV